MLLFYFVDTGIGKPALFLSSDLEDAYPSERDAGNFFQGRACGCRFILAWRMRSLAAILCVAFACADASREGALYQSYDAYAGAQGFYEPAPQDGGYGQEQQQQQPPGQDAFAQVCASLSDPSKGGAARYEFFSCL